MKIVNDVRGVTRCDPSHDTTCHLTLHYPGGQGDSDITVAWCMGQTKVRSKVSFLNGLIRRGLMTLKVYKSLIHSDDCETKNTKSWNKYLLVYKNVNAGFVYLCTDSIH